MNASDISWDHLADATLTHDQPLAQADWRALQAEEDATHVRNLLAIQHPGLSRAIESAVADL